MSNIVQFFSDEQQTTPIYPRTNSDAVIYKNNTLTSTIDSIMNDGGISGDYVTNSEFNDAVNGINGSLSMHATRITNIENASGISALSNAYAPIDGVSFGTYMRVISPSDAGASYYDNLRINYTTMMKMNENLYYMWYNCTGKCDLVYLDSRTTSPQYSYYTGFTGRYANMMQHLGFAWSSDGLNWHHELPTGYTGSNAPLSEYNINTYNMIFMYGVEAPSVVQVNDSEYPLRMIANYGGTLDSSVQVYMNGVSGKHTAKKLKRDRVRMFKSKDGINWTKVRDILVGDYDGPIYSISHGNTITCYCRIRTYFNSTRSRRQIGQYTIDMNGNIVSPPTLRLDTTDEYDIDALWQFYGAGAVQLDSMRDILFPTLYRDKNQNKGVPGVEWLSQSYIVSNEQITMAQTSNIHNLFGLGSSATYFPGTIAVVGNGMQDVDGVSYLYYGMDWKGHDETVYIGTLYNDGNVNNGFTDKFKAGGIFRVPVTFNTQGRALYIYDNNTIRENDDLQEEKDKPENAHGLIFVP